MSSSLLSKLKAESGLETVIQSPFDTKLLCVLRFVRLLAYGSSTLVLALFLASLDITEARIGLFMTLTLLGDVLLSFFLTLFADSLGRRKVLAAGAALMAMSGVAFSSTSNYWILVLASVFGVISPSGNEIGPFRAIEESMLAQLTPKDVRTDVLSWYELFGTAGAAIGTLLAGGIVQTFEGKGWQTSNAYRVIFMMYSILGLVKFALNAFLTPACEPQIAEYQSVSMTDGADEDNTEGEESQSIKPSVISRIRTMIPTISPESRSIVRKLCTLFGVDSFASGLVAASWVSYYFTTTFNVEPKILGTIFFATNLVASASNLVAAPLAKRIGLVKTMVFTHLPSAMFLATIPIPRTVGPATALLILRHCTSSMDRAPRQAFLAAAVLSSERTAVMGFVNVVKTLAQSTGPLVTGYLAGVGRFWMVFAIAGGLKAGYDISILRLFSGFQGREADT